MRLLQPATPFALTGLLMAAPVAQAGGSLELVPSQDNTLYETPADTEEASYEMSNGEGSFLFSGRTGLDAGFNRRRALLKFDLAAALPANATITYAELILNQSKAAPGSPPVSMGLYRLQQSWGEGASDGTGPEGQGAPAQTGDATWFNRIYPDTPWDAPGGVFAVSASTATTVGESLQHYTWPCSAAMLSDLNDWLETPATNYGWALVGGEDDGFSAHRFGSRENGTADNRPVLKISYITDDDLFADSFEPTATCPAS